MRAGIGERRRLRENILIFFLFFIISVFMFQEGDIGLY